MMSKDPNQWVVYDQLSAPSRKRIETNYPYLKVDQSVFQEKESGVFVRHTNTGKVEKLLEQERNLPGRAKAAAKK